MSHDSKLEVDKKLVGTRIKKIRLELGETAEVFGKHFDPPANRGLVSGWENGRYLPSPERIKVIAELGNISVTDLVEYKLSVPLLYQEVINSEDITQEEKKLLEDIKDEFIPLLEERLNLRQNTTYTQEEFYITDRIISVAQAFTKNTTLNRFDETFNGYHFPTIKEDLEFFSNNIPYLKGKKYVYVNTDENYQLLVKDQVEQSLKARDIIQSEKELQSLEDTKSTFADIIKSYEEIEQLQYSDSVNQVYNANLDYQNGKSDIRIYDGASYIDYLEFANRYFSELLDDSDIINEIGSRKQFSTGLNSQIAVDLFKNGIEKNISDNNRLIEQIQNNLIK
ncbi:helix-turn-helix domain-containing protein [Aerococcus urinaeequi]